MLDCLTAKKEAVEPQTYLGGTRACRPFIQAALLAREWSFGTLKLQHPFCRFPRCATPRNGVRRKVSWQMSAVIPEYFSANAFFFLSGVASPLWKYHDCRRFFFVASQCTGIEKAQWWLHGAKTCVLNMENIKMQTYYCSLLGSGGAFPLRRCGKTVAFWFQTHINLMRKAKNIITCLIVC